MFGETIVLGNEVEAAHELINLQYMYVPPLTALAGPSRELRP